MAKRRKRSKKGKPRGTAGRRPTGLVEGEKLSDYPRLTVRVPPATVDQLRKLAGHQQRQQWRVLVDAIREYAGRVLEGER